MKVEIVDGCIGCGLCVNICPAVFHMMVEGVAEVLEQPSAPDEAAAQEAADGCPVSVIMIEK